MRIGVVLFLLVANATAYLVHLQSSDLVGQWKVDITFDNHSKRSLRFDAFDSGKGSFLVEERGSNWSEPSKPSEAKWFAAAEKIVTFMGPVEFPIGNVGRERGTLSFKGKFENEDSLSGKVELFPEGLDPSDAKATPSKTGKFTATRVRPG